MKRVVWKPAEIETLRQLYPHVSTALIAFELRRPLRKVYDAAARLGLHKTAAYLASPEACWFRKHPEIGTAHRFRPGQTPANKGMRRPGYAPGRMAETQYRAGEMRGKAALNHKPAGTTLTDDDGYLRIKVRERQPADPPGWCKEVWPLLHWHIWQQHHGPIPAGHAVSFRDGDRSHCQIENLELISRRELMARNSIHNLPAELVAVIQLNSALKRKINRRSHEKQDVRSA